jgi:acetyl esterase
MNTLDTLRFFGIFLRIKLIGITSRFLPLPGGKLDEQTELLRRAQHLLGEVPLDDVTVEKARLDMRNSMLTLKNVGGLFERVDTIRDMDIPGPAGSIPVRLYQPGPETGLPIFVLLHGGGWVIGDRDTADNMARFICKRAHCVVLSVDYRLAPEHPFPAAPEDCYAAFCWTVDHAAEINGDPRWILVGGDSAGGTLTAVVAQMTVQRGGPKLAGQVLMYASTDSSSLDTPSYKEFGDKNYGLPKRDVEWFLRQYITKPADRLDPMVSPLLAKDLHGLAYAVVITGEFDVLRDEAEAYAKRLEAAGVPVKLMRCNGMVHGFLSMLGMVKRAEIYFDQVIAEIKKLTAA